MEHAAAVERMRRRASGIVERIWTSGRWTVVVAVLLHGFLVLDVIAIGRGHLPDSAGTRTFFNFLCAASVISFLLTVNTALIFSKYSRKAEALMRKYT